MAKKEHINITRSDDFAAIEEDLAVAIDSLDDANARIEALLHSQQTEGLASENDSPEADAPEDASQPTPLPDAR